MKKMLFLATIFTVGSLAAISSDDYPMLNQEAQDQQIEEGRLQDQRLQDRRLESQRLESRRQDQRVQDRRLEQRRLENQRRYVADSMDRDQMTQDAKPMTVKKDRFTTTEDHMLANLIRAKIAEISPDSDTNDIILVIDNGDVKLVGKINSSDKRTRLSQMIQQMKGVRSVHNKLEVSK